MKKVYKYRGKLKLEVGKYYLFNLSKIVMSPDRIKYLVVIDPLGDRHLIQAGYYNNYNFEFNKNYLCKVDKVNCKGRIFIEPPHPFYKENVAYLFEFIAEIREKHKSGSFYSYYEFKGENKYPAFLQADNNNLPAKMKSGLHYMLVKKISKGKVFIEIPDNNLTPPKFQT